MRFISRFFKDQVKSTKNYFSKTPLFITIPAILNVFSCLSVFAGIVSSIIKKNPNIFIVFLLITIVSLLISLCFKNTYFIDPRYLYLNDDTFLTSVITNIREVKRLKSQEHINSAIIKKLIVNYYIGESSEHESIIQSPLDVEWIINGNVRNQELCRYDIINSKSNSGKSAKPEIRIRRLADGSEFQPTFTYEGTGISNHFWAFLGNRRLCPGDQFKITINLNSYYRFLWQDYETFIVNTSLYGDVVEELKIELKFSDNRIKGTNIPIYEVNMKNLKRKMIQYLDCENNIYTFETKDATGRFFLIVIPKSDIHLPNA